MQTLAFDLGGSSLRLAIVAPDLRFLAQVRKPLRIRNHAPGVFEADPAVWWQAFMDGCTELAAMGHDLGAIDAVAGCGFTRTQVFLDGAGGVLRPAIAFQDSRAAVVLDKIRAGPLGEAISGLGPFDPLARLLWVREREPQTWAKLRLIVEPKDYLNLQLTGLAVSDTISQTPMTRARTGRQGDPFTLLDLDPAVLPAAHSPFTVIGQVRDGLTGPLAALAGAAVHCGSIDTWSNVLGSGGLTPGVAYGISGTSDVSGVISDRPHQADGLLSIEWGPGLWQLGGPSQGAATRLQWGIDRFCPGIAPDIALANALASPRAAPLFLPCLDGERVPWWDPDLRGAFLGLTASHTAPDFLRGVAEGMNYLAREVLTRAVTAIGTPVRHLCFSGGLAGNPLLCQLKADVLDRPLFVPDNPQTGLMGAARIPLGQCRKACQSQPDDLFYHPDPARRAYHDDRFAVFQDASLAIRNISHQLAKLETPADPDKHDETSDLA